MDHRFDRGKCSMRWHEHLIAGVNSHDVMEQKNSRRPRGTENRLFGAGVIGQFGFEGFALFRQNVRPRFKRAHRRFSDLLIEKNARKRDFFHRSAPSISIHAPVLADSSAASTTRIARNPAHPSATVRLRLSIESMKAASSARSGSSGGNSS